MIERQSSQSDYQKCCVYVCMFQCCGCMYVCIYVPMLWVYVCSNAVGISMYVYTLQCCGYVYVRIYAPMLWVYDVCMYAPMLWVYVLQYGVRIYAPMLWVYLCMYYSIENVKWNVRSWYSLCSRQESATARSSQDVCMYVRMFVPSCG